MTEIPTTIRSPSDLLAWRAGESPDAPFLTFRNTTLTWEVLNERVDRLAAGLWGLGIAPGDNVAVMLLNSVDHVTVWLALNRLGAVEVPINPEHRGYLLEHIVNQACCRTVIADHVAFDALCNARAGTGLQQIILRGAPDRLEDADFVSTHDFETVATSSAQALPQHSCDLLSILFTSGTTGPSKGVMISSAFALTMGRAIIRAARYTPNDKLYNALPMFHGNAKLLSLLPAMIAGAQVVLAEKFSASGFWLDVRDHGCTEFNYIGGILSILLKAPPTPADRDHQLRIMVGAGASAAVQDAFEERFGVNLIEAYGTTEIGAPIISLPENRRAGSCGMPTDDYAVRLTGEDGREVGQNEVGELWVRPRHLDSIFRGYFGMPEATVAAWQDLWFRTGDNMRRDDEGYFFFVDRKKDAIRRLGENISSFEIEQIALGFSGISEVAAVPVASELGEDEVLLCVVPRDSALFDVDDLHAYCSAQMAAYMRPRYYRVLDQLPKTPTERVQKFVLRNEGMAEGTIDIWAGGNK